MATLFSVVHKEDFLKEETFMGERRVKRRILASKIWWGIMTVANLFISSVYSHEGYYKSALLLTATRYIRNGTVSAGEGCIRGSFENEVQLSE